MSDGYRALPPPRGTFTDEKTLAAHVLEVMSKWFHIEEQVPGAYWTGEKTRIDAVLRPRDPAGWHDDDPALGVEFKPESADTGDLYGGVAQAVAYTHCQWRSYGTLPVFLCPSPFAHLLTRSDEVTTHRQRQIAPEILAEEQERVRRYGRRYGTEYKASYVDYRALEAHRQRLGEMTYQEFTARADGFADADAREREHRLRVARELRRLLGHLNVGELMPYEHTGWTFTRSGSRVWNEVEGPAKIRHGLRPRIGSQRRKSNEPG